MSDLASDPAIRKELLAVTGRLIGHADPCGAKVVIATLTPLVSLYGVQDKAEAEWRTFWGLYVDALGSLPAEALRAGVAAYVSDAKSEFFPKPGPLRALCEPFAIPIRMARNRAVKALERIV